MDIVCVDFDGTISDHRFPLIGEEVPLAVDWMKTWHSRKINIILHTMRSNGQESGNVLDEAVGWLHDRGVVLLDANRNPTQHVWTTSPKTYGHVYIDDAAFGCPLIHPQGFARPCVDWSIVGPGVLTYFGKG